MKFNVNHEVRVKLTPRGRMILTEQDREFLRAHNIAPAAPPEEDTDGYSTWQLWTLMHTFGNHMVPGFEPPFETEIEIPEGTNV